MKHNVLWEHSLIILLGLVLLCVLSILYHSRIGQQKDVFMSVQMGSSVMMTVEIVQIPVQLLLSTISWIMKSIVVFQVHII